MWQVDSSSPPVVPTSPNNHWSCLFLMLHCKLLPGWEVRMSYCVLPVPCVSPSQCGTHQFASFLGTRIFLPQLPGNHFRGNNFFPALKLAFFVPLHKCGTCYSAIAEEARGRRMGSLRGR